jgi:hypothetical protein
MTLPTPSGADSAARAATPLPTTGATSTHLAWFGARPTETQRKRRRTNRIGSAVTVIVAIAIAVTRLVLGLHESDGDRGSLWFFVITVVVLGLILWGSLASTTSSVRRRGAVAVEARPGAEVFASARTPELRAALKASDLTDKGLPRVVIVSVSTTGIELWGKRKLTAPVVSISWPNVDHVQPAHLRVSAGRSSRDARTVNVFAEVATGPCTIPLPVFGPRALNYANVARANEVMSWFARYTRVVGTDI